MKGPPVPSVNDLQNAYDVLQVGKGVPTIKQLVTYAQWVRIDPRLAEILIYKLLHLFNELNPFQLWKENGHSSFPQSLAVVLEFAKLRAPSALSKAEQSEFQVWCEIVVKNLQPAAAQMFFISPGNLNPERDLQESHRSTKPYSRWGFLSYENLLNDKVMQKLAATTWLSKAKRLNLLKQLLSAKPSITVNDYIQACRGQVHRRTAERDLNQFPNLKRAGFTRNRTYRLASRNSLAK